MAEEYDWANDGGVFIAGGSDGYRLVETIDWVFSQNEASPEKYMNLYYPDAKKDIVPHKQNLREKVGMGAFVGFVAVVGATGVWSIWSISNQLIESLRNIN